MSSDTTVRFDNVCKRFPNSDALRGLSLEVPAASITALLGRNGAGKTTALKCLMGLLRADSGEMTIFGEDTRRLSIETRQRVGYVSERSGLDARLTVDQMIRLNRPLYPRWDDALCDDLLDRLEIGTKQRIGELSLGQVRKVALLLNLAFRPDLLVLDEPAANLDAVVRREFLVTVLELFRDHGMTVVLSTHQLSDVERFADRVALIEDGELRKSAALDDLKETVKAIRFSPAQGDEVDLPRLPGELRRRHVGEALEITVENYTSGLEQSFAAAGSLQAAVLDLPLEDIFIAYSASGDRLAPDPLGAIPGEQVAGQQRPGGTS